MTKNELISFVRVSLLKREAHGDDQKTYHFQRVAQAVNYAFNTLLSQIPLDTSGKRKIESYYVKHYYNQPVSESSTYRYFGISDDIVPIGDGLGVWYVQPSGGGVPFARFNRPELGVFRGLAVGEVVNDTFWRFGNISTKKQIILENVGDSPMSDIRFVDYGIVRALSSYSGTEKVEVPDGRMDILEQLVTTWLQTNPTTPANDNT